MFMLLRGADNPGRRQAMFRKAKIETVAFVTAVAICFLASVAGVQAQTVMMSPQDPTSVHTADKAGVETATKLNTKRPAVLNSRHIKSEVSMPSDEDKACPYVPYEPCSNQGQGS
jgi:hypothetical protein